MTMTDAASAVRTYTVGDTADSYAYHRPTHEWCQDTHDGYVCTIKAGHTGPQHIGAGISEIAAVWDRDTSGDEPAAPEGTWKAGDHVQGQHNGRILGSGVVLGTTTDDDVTTAAIVARFLYDDDFQFMRVPVTDLAPMRDGSELPSPEVIAEAVTRWSRNAARRVQVVSRARDTAMTELATFREQVRETAITYAQRHGWCTVVDEALKEMGLEPRTREFTVEVVVTATQTVTVTVEASSEDDAKSEVSTDDVRNQVSSYDWSWDSDDWEIEDVSEA